MKKAEHKINKKIVQFLTDGKDYKPREFPEDIISFFTRTSDGKYLLELFAAYNKKEDRFAYYFEDTWYNEENMLRVMKMKAFI